MQTTRLWLGAGLGLLALLSAGPALADAFFFSTGDTDGRMAMASRPAIGSFGIETADDFVLTDPTTLTSATFTGLLTGVNSAPVEVKIEIFRVFPQDSDVGRTSGPPLFSTSQVPTRVNSPADVAFASRDSADSSLNFFTTQLQANFTADNSVAPGGINPSPGQTTGGNGPVTGTEVEFGVSFATPLVLAAGHYFFVPEVALDTGDFFWLSAPRPIVPPGTPFAPDLQTWTRDDFLAPDWLRVGTDIVGGSPAPTFNATFSLTGETAPVAPVPEPGSAALLLGAIAGLRLTRRRPA